MIKKVWLTLLLYVAAALLIPPVHAQESIIDQIIKAQSSIVGIKAENPGWFKAPSAEAVIDHATGRVVVGQKLARASYQRYGAGVIIHPSGVIVTNAHNVHKAQYIKIVLTDNREVFAQVVRFVNNMDLALLKINPPYPLAAVPIADSDKIQLGDEIMTVGSSQLLNQTLSGGKVIGLGTRQGGGQIDLIQTTINLFEGDSGGPLFDSQGRLVGLMTAGESRGKHSSFAVPSNKIMNFLTEYLNSKP